MIRFSASAFLEGSAVIVVGVVIVHSLMKVFKYLTKNSMETTNQLILEKSIKYLAYSLIVIFGLKQMGIDLKLLLGAAGVFSVALGFASQTSASNLISGIFLLVERPFALGDTIKIGDVKGVVVSIDLLSTRVRTSDNTMVRIPNENLMKSQIQNLTFFSIRRIDIKFTLKQKEDIQKIEQLLFLIAENNKSCLDEPKPIFVINGFLPYGLDIQFSFWVLKENVLATRNQFYKEVLNAFTQNNITLSKPFAIDLSETL